MKSFLRSWWQLIIILLCSPYVYACEPAKRSSYPQLAIDGGFIIFHAVAVLEDEGEPSPEMGIGISFLNCANGEENFIARLPYVADPGEVQDAFIADSANGKDELFVIHSAPIRAFTGINYGSDYFSVMAFRREEDRYSLDKNLTEYLGSGADVVDRQGDVDVPIYIYPYKSRAAVFLKLSSRSYLDWANKIARNLTVIDRAEIYSSMSIANSTEMYLVKGDRVRLEQVSAGWGYILYVTAKGKEIHGWILCEKLGGC
ncbi:hypothetical protein HX797_16920 [Pseudomonas edaphica]|uniref:SH3 domain-containing protein n=1 Tax=Pseudomonas edaphica TaxID=2006980 RepID=A0A7Y7V8A9_9PSED|nr:hypothetical protein [Pseudomonas edaphica]NVZ57948.1 hypothetical protein [Pseudomonas edaphica]